MMTPQFLIPIILAVVGFVVWYFWDKRKKKNAPQKPVEINYESIKAIIYDRTTLPFTWYEKTLEPIIVKAIAESGEMGRQMTYMGKKFFRYYKMFNSDKKEYYEAVRDPNDVTNSPVSSYIDMQHPYISILDDTSTEKNFVQKYGHLLIWMGVIACVIALIVLNKK